MLSDPTAQRPTRRPYRSPRLRCYGTIRKLTAGGSGTDVEKMMMTAPLKRP